MQPNEAASMGTGWIAGRIILALALGATTGIPAVGARLIDQWRAADIEGVVDQTPIWLWPSSNGREAYLGGFETPRYQAVATPAGGPALRFPKVLMQVDPQENPLGGRDAFSIVAVVRFHSEATSVGGLQWWENTPWLDTDTENGADWGLALSPQGQVGFGIGQPDRTVFSDGRSLVDESFHVVVATWEAGQTMTLRVDNGDPVAVGGAIPVDPRDALLMTIGGATAGVPEDKLADMELVELRFYEDAMPADEALLLANTLAVEHGLQFRRLISRFTASARGIASGESVTLDWVVAPDVSVTLLPAPGAVDELTTNGIGRVNLTPANDTKYVLQAVRDGVTNETALTVMVSRTAAESLVDVWEAPEGPEGPLAAWTSHNGRTATAETDADRPAVLPAATPGGTPAVRFADSRLATSPESNPLAGATEATILYVARFNAAPTRNEGDQWWGQTGIIDASGDVPDQAGWGCVIRPDGTVGFGVGAPDQTIYSAGEPLVDEQFHLVVQTWGPAGLTLQVDDADPVSLAGEASRLPRTATAMVFGDLAGGGASVAADVAEIRFYDEALSPTELEAVRSELAEKHGLGQGVAVPPYAIIAQGFDQEGHFYVTVPAVAGVRYRLLVQPLSGGEWTEITSARATGSELTLVDPRAPEAGGLYWVVADAGGGLPPLEPFFILRGGFSGPGTGYVVVQSVPGHTYALLKKTALGESEWTEVDRVTAEGTETTLSDPQATESTAFYRVVGE